MDISSQLELVCRIVLQEHYDRYHKDSRGGNSLRRSSTSYSSNQRTVELRLGAHAASGQGSVTPDGTNLWREDPYAGIPLVRGRGGQPPRLPGRPTAQLRPPALTLKISNWAPTNEIDSRSNPQAFLTDDLVMAFPYACACARELKSKSSL
jgi:hypothetical protein